MRKQLRQIIKNGLKAKETSKGIRRKVSSVFFPINGDTPIVPMVGDFSVNRLQCSCTNSALEYDKKSGENLTISEAQTIARFSGLDSLVSRTDVQHAEIGALKKLEESYYDNPNQVYGLYVSATTCTNCAKAIIKSDLTNNLQIVVFSELYREMEGLKILLEAFNELTVYVEDPNGEPLRINGQTADEIINTIIALLPNGGASGLKTNPEGT